MYRIMEFKSEPSDDSEYAQFCMICLDTSEGRKLFPATTYSLDSEFERLTGISLQDEMQFLPQFCAECARRLSNCSKLRNKCLRAYHSLLGLVQKHNMVTVDAIKKIDRTYNQLVSNIVKISYKPNHCDLHVIETQENVVKWNLADINTNNIVDVQYDPESFNSDVEFLDDSFDDDAFIGKNEGQYSDVGSSNEYIVGSLDYDTDISSYDTGTLATDREIKKENDNRTDYISNDVARKIKLNLKHETKRPLCNVRVTSGEAYSANSVGEFEANRKPSINKSIDCEHCGVKLSGHRIYAEHVRTLHPDKGSPHKRRAKPKANTKCDECGRVFRAPVLLREHMHRHTGVKMYKCDICGAGFSQKVSMRLHVTRHSVKQSYPCEVCHRPFANPANLKRHMPTHELVRQSYTCQECGKSFTSKPGRDQHIAHVHNKVPWPKKIKRRRRHTESAVQN